MKAQSLRRLPKSTWTIHCSDWELCSLKSDIWTILKTQTRSRSWSKRKTSRTLICLKKWLLSHLSELETQLKCCQKKCHSKKQPNTISLHRIFSTTIYQKFSTNTKKRSLKFKVFTIISKASFPRLWTMWLPELSAKSWEMWSNSMIKTSSKWISSSQKFTNNFLTKCQTLLWSWLNARLKLSSRSTSSMNWFPANRKLMTWWKKNSGVSSINHWKLLIKWLITQALWLKMMWNESQPCTMKCIHLKNSDFIVSFTTTLWERRDNTSMKSHKKF